MSRPVRIGRDGNAASSGLTASFSIHFCQWPMRDVLLLLDHLREIGGGYLADQIVDVAEVFENE